MIACGRRALGGLSRPGLDATRAPRLDAQALAPARLAMSAMPRNAGAPQRSR